ncbi:MAG: phosphatidylserine decarboxylase, partial [Bacilli bacterium]
MKKNLYRFLIELTNKKWSSVLLYRFSRSRFSRYLIPSFIRAYNINTAEIEQPVQSYTSLHDFFTRRLKQGERIIHGESNSLVSPVDGTIAAFGTLAEDDSFQVKGKSFSVEELLGNKTDAQRYVGGHYMVIYLSPTNYHRIHAPMNGTLIADRTLGDASYPVNDWGVRYGKRTLSKNFRVVSEFQQNRRRLALVKVGAMFVNCIERTHTNEEVHKGEEIAYFSFGSTVVLLTEKEAVQWDVNCVSNRT